MALNVAVVEPAETVTVDAGTGRSALLLAMETDVPPLGADWFKVAVQLALAPELKVVGVQTKELRVSAGVRLIVEV